MLNTSWQPMDTAPRDGTVVEIMCSYGGRPWFGRHKWSAVGTVLCRDEHGAQSFEEEIFSKPRWVSVDRPGHGLSDEKHCKWRPYHRVAEPYVDPTGGAQFGKDYWEQGGP